MTLKEYQQQAMTTCLANSKNFSYMMLNLVGEVGEFSSKVAKAIRKGQITTDKGYLHGTFPPEFMTDLRKEAGDILWQLSGLCTVMGWDFEEVAVENLVKLYDRQRRDIIDGNGDNR